MKITSMFFCVSIFCLLYTNANSQNIKNPVFKNQDSCSLQYLFEKYCDQHIVEVSDTVCVETCIFVKFQIDDNGNVKNISINKDAVLDLKNLIVSFLKTTDKRWGKNNAKKILLLPVAFSIHKGKCVVNQKMLTDVIQMLQFNNNVSGNQAPTIMGYKNEMPLDCTLLNPIIYLSPID